MINPLKKVLVIRFSSIGDVVLTTPVVRNLSNNGFEVYYLTKPFFVSILENNPYIKKVFGAKEITTEILSELSSLSFDYIIDLHQNGLSSTVRNHFKDIPNFIVDKQNAKKLLLVWTKSKAFGVSHIVDRYLDTIKSLCPTLDNKGLDYYPHPMSNSLDNLINKPYICFVIGGQHQGKMMSKEKMLEICRSVKNKRIYVIGGPEDKKVGDWLEEKAENVTNFAGELSISDSAHLVKNCQLVLTHDTGFMHIASAFKKDIFSFWGATTPELGFAPYKPGEKSKIFQAKHWLRPTSKLGKQRWSGFIRFIDRIPTKDIVREIEFLLNS
jgi:heptosyltransferase-2